ncbi:MAG: hypothetical protein HUU37_08715, partial [Bdellovibrionales bacterium]|nr:hypothetical protein [Bdellovibrionales bacterium]
MATLGGGVYVPIGTGQTITWTPELPRTYEVRIDGHFDWHLIDVQRIPTTGVQMVADNCTLTATSASGCLMDFSSTINPDLGDEGTYSIPLSMEVWMEHENGINKFLFIPSIDGLSDAEPTNRVSDFGVNFLDWGTHAANRVPGLWHVKVRANNNGVYGNEVTGSFTLLPEVVVLPEPNFDVLLHSNGKKYLFDDCAPFGDPCKSFKDTHKGGEFLLGDVVTGVAAVGNWQTCQWVLEPVSGAAQEFPATPCASPQSMPLPATGAGDYRIRLRKLLSSGAVVDEGSKLIKVRERIEIAFSGSDAISEQQPYPVFFQSDYKKGAGKEIYDDKWNKNGGGGDYIASAGCPVTAMAMLAGIKGMSPELTPKLPDNSALTIPNFNRYLSGAGGFSPAELNKNGEKIGGYDFYFDVAAKEINRIAGDPVVLSETKNFVAVPKEELVTGPARDHLEHLARKRKLVVLKAHSRSHGVEDDPSLPDFK